MELTQRRALAACTQWRAELEAHSGPRDLRALEGSVAFEGRELLRRRLELEAQKQASATPPHCPRCGRPLRAVVWREVELLSSFGPIKISRAYGRCLKCRAWFAPADAALGVADSIGATPAMAERLQLLGTIAPPGQAEAISETLLGQRVDDSRIARELERGGREVLDQRAHEDERALSTEGRWQVTRELARELPTDFTMIVMADAFMTRERDDWGRSREIRAGGGQPERWHETKVGTIFLLADRARCGGKNNRSVILSRSFLATRAEAFSFGQMLYAQAIRQGLLRAKEVYFVADGGVWLWTLHKERFKGATGTLDFFHASQHLWSVARARHGDGPAATAWVEPLLGQLRHNGEADVLSTLEELAAVVEAIEPEQRNVDDKTILREWEYFQSHRAHLGYGPKAQRGLPIGSGCVESTCKQYQLRVKRCGQFWSHDQLEGVLCLYGRYLSHCYN